MYTRSKTANKRNWPLHFDANSDQGQIEPKKKKMNELETGNMENTGQFRDLSSTIINRPGHGNIDNNPQTAPTGIENEGDNFLTPGTRRVQSRDVNLEERVKDIVSNEVKDLRKTIDILVKTVQNMTSNTTNVTPRTVNFDGHVGNGNIPQSDLPAVSNAMASRERIQSGTSSSSGYYFPPVPMKDHLRIRVDKFGINFDGNPLKLTVEEFIFRLECLKEQYDIPWDEILRDFRLLVSGPALEWFWQLQKMRKFTQWVRLKDALLSQYRATKSPFEAMKDLVERKQMANEPIDTYFHAMGQLRSRLPLPITDEDMIKIIKSNVRENIKMVIYPMSISTVELLRVECKDAEKNFPKRDTRQMAPIPRQIRQVNEVTYDDYEYEEPNPQIEVPDTVSAIRMAQQHNKVYVCWNCQESGHTFVDCPSTARSLFCYRCGKQNTITPKCPNCQKGNYRRGVETTGETRPAGNPEK